MSPPGLRLWTRPRIVLFNREGLRGSIHPTAGVIIRRQREPVPVRPSGRISTGQLSSTRLRKWTEVDIESTPPASKPKVGSDAYDARKIWDDAVERCLAHSSRATSKRGGGATSAAGGAATSAAGGGATSAAGGAATSAAGGAASTGHESLDSSEEWPWLRARSDRGFPKILQEDRKSNTFMGSELVEYLTRQH